MIHHTNRRVALSIAASLALGGATGANAATQSVSYASIDTSVTQAYIADYDTTAKTAHITETFGVGDGTYIDSGNQRIVSVDWPAYVIDAVDCNGLPMTQIVNLQQLVFRTISGTSKKGTSAVVEIGNTVDQGGCTPGAVTPFGSLTDPGLATNTLDMTLRAAITDLKPGSQLAGLSETPSTVFDDWILMTQQVVTVNASSVKFQTSGNTAPASLSNGWVVVKSPTFTRGYTRLTRDTTTGVEHWLVAEWKGGKPVTAQLTTMTKPNASAGFGGAKGAAHDWHSGLFLNSPTQAYFDLYKDLTGDFIQVTSDGTTFSSPATWALSGADLTISRTIAANTFVKRTWVPLANYGTTHQVMESENFVDASGNFLSVRITPRVNFYIDEGKSTKPAIPALPTGRPAAPGAGALR